MAITVPKTAKELLTAFQSLSLKEQLKFLASVASALATENANKKGYLTGEAYLEMLQESKNQLEKRETIALSSKEILEFAETK